MGGPPSPHIGQPCQPCIFLIGISKLFSFPNTYKVGQALLTQCYCWLQIFQHISHSCRRMLTWLTQEAKQRKKHFQFRGTLVMVWDNWLTRWIYNSIPGITLHLVTFNVVTIYYVTLPYVTFLYDTLHGVNIPGFTLTCVTSPGVTFPGVTLHFCV